MLRAAATSYPSDADLPMRIAMLDNEITKECYDLDKDTPIEMLESDKTEYFYECRTYR